MRCFSESVIRSHRGPVWHADTTLTTRIKLTRFPSDTAGNNIQPMDISGSNGVFGCEYSHISPKGKLTYKIPRGREANYSIGPVLECRIFLRILLLFPLKVKPMTFINKPFEP